MKKEISPAVIIGGIVGLLAILGVVFFLVSKSDPASQAPNPPPAFSADAAAAKEQQHGNMPADRNPNAVPR